MTNFIEIEHIPRWLENSNLSKVFKENDNNSALLIPENKYKKNINILNVNDFYRYIEIYRYWMMDDCPFEIYDYFLKNYSIIDLEFLKNEFNDTIIIKELIILISSLRYKVMDIAAQNGYLNLLKYAYENQFPCSKNTTSKAAKYGHLESLKFLIENGCPFDKEVICLDAIENNHLDCLKYLCENGCEFPVSIYYTAIKNGSFHCLKYAVESGSPNHPYACSIASSFGRLDFLEYLHKKNFLLDEDSCIEAASNGHLDCLKYSIENISSTLNIEDICFNAIGHIDCLKYLHKEKAFRLSEMTCSISAYNRHLDCLIYGFENGCSIEDIDTNLSMYENINIECLNYINQKKNNIYNI